jgi:hypothetical protein
VSENCGWDQFNALYVKQDKNPHAIACAGVDNHLSVSSVLHVVIAFKILFRISAEDQILYLVYLVPNLSAVSIKDTCRPQCLAPP